MQERERGDAVSIKRALSKIKKEAFFSIPVLPLTPLFFKLLIYRLYLTQN